MADSKSRIANRASHIANPITQSPIHSITPSLHLNHMSDSFSRVLEARRAYFNARFAEKQITRPDLDGDAFLHVLREYVAPVVEAVAQRQEDAALVVGQHLYDVALDLFADGLFLSESIIARAWRELFPHTAPFLIQQPQRVAASVVNAAYNISQTLGARPEQWLETMRALAPFCANAEIFLQAGQVAAWRAGMAHYRIGALQILKTLDEKIVRVIFGLDVVDVNALHYALMANPWYVPATDNRTQNTEKRLKVVKRVGSFRGFGGTFLAPPRVMWTKEGFVASDENENYLVFADAFGATLHRVETTREEKISSPFQLNRDGKVMLEKISVVMPELANATSFAANQNTLAVTSELTHAIVFVAVK